MASQLRHSPVERQLWGGAFSVQLPAVCLDASDLRQVPDNQEVFLHPRHDQSIVLELLDRLPVATTEAAAREFFADLAEANGAAADPGDSRVTRCRALAGAIGEFAHLTGEQRVAKCAEPGRNLVEIHVLLHRLEGHGCDLAVTLNHPISVCPESSSASLFDPESAWQPDAIVSMVTESLALRDPSIFAA